MEYLFTLKYQLADADSDLDALVERLGEAGCDDALVGMGLPGRLVLEFTREADSAEAAVRSALADVRRAMPTAALIEAAPDLVGLTDVAQIVGVSRQNMRKLMLAHPATFPAPMPRSAGAGLDALVG
ncbi:DNA-binding protein [Bordetella pertussis]|uniref:DNA-binding protein n=1 Tax=Bordetella pertussis TaxID=520 RepID=UPI0005DC49AD|nr:DNA-binding protein [Bordetella pertussis]CPQ46083.1 DNA-binding protein [Bordetella pertussis]